MARKSYTVTPKLDIYSHVKERYLQHIQSFVKKGSLQQLGERAKSNELSPEERSAYLSLWHILGSLRSERLLDSEPEENTPKKDASVLYQSLQEAAERVARVELSNPALQKPQDKTTQWLDQLFILLYENDNRSNESIYQEALRGRPDSPTAPDIAQQLKSQTRYSNRFLNPFHPDNPVRAFVTSILGFRYHPLKRYNVPYVAFQDGEAKCLRMGTQTQGSSEVNPAFKRYLLANARQIPESPPLKETAHEIPEEWVVSQATVPIAPIKEVLKEKHKEEKQEKAVASALEPKHKRPTVSLPKVLELPEIARAKQGLHYRSVKERVAAIEKSLLPTEGKEKVATKRAAPVSALPEKREGQAKAQAPEKKSLKIEGEIPYIYFNLLKRERAAQKTSFLGQVPFLRGLRDRIVRLSEGARGRSLEALNEEKALTLNGHKVVTVVTLPADSALLWGHFDMHTDLAVLKGKYSTKTCFEEMYDSIENNLNDFYISQDVKEHVLGKKPEDRRAYLAQLFEEAVSDILGESKKDQAFKLEISAEERAAVTFHFIKEKITSAFLKQCQPRAYNITCKDAIDRGAIHALWHQMQGQYQRFLKGEGEPLSEATFLTQLDSAAMLVKLRSLNHNRNAIGNALLYRMQADPLFAKAHPWAWQWLARNMVVRHDEIQAAKEASRRAQSAEKPSVAIQPETPRHMLEAKQKKPLFQFPKLIEEAKESTALATKKIAEKIRKKQPRPPPPGG